MTRTTKIFIILCLAILLGAAKLVYDEFFGPQNAAALQQEKEEAEARKLKQLEADLLRAAAAGRGNYKKSTSAGISKRKIDRTRRTGST